MRWWAFAVIVAAGGCSFDSGLGVPADAQPDGELGRPDAAPGTLLWRVEDEADFVTGGTLASVAVARGGIEPFAYAYGALNMRGSNATEFTDPTPPDLWNTLLAKNPSGTALATLPPFDQRRPGGVGLDADTSWTLWADGEIYLEAGTHAFELTADDDGFLEIGDGNGVFTRVVSESIPNQTVAGSFDAPTAGWYPVRMAMSQGVGGATFFLTDDPAGSPPRAPVERWRYRVPVNRLQGMFQLAFDEEWLVEPRGTDLYALPLLAEDWSTNTPPDLGLTAQDTFTLRWVGQLHVDTADAYTFSTDTDDGHRLWIDGVMAIDNWIPDQPRTGTSAPIALAPGWHDLIFEMMQGGGTSHASLAMASSTGSAAMIPLDRLRPATGRRERVATATRDINENFENGNFDKNLDFFVVGAPGAFANRVDLGFTATHTNWGEVTVALDPPAGTGTPHTVFDVGGDSSPDTQFHNDLFTPAADWPVNGRWQFRFSDSAGGTSGVAEQAELTVHYNGGEPTIARSAVWTSEIHDLGRTATIENVMYSDEMPAGATVDLEVQSCAMTDCSNGQWRAVASSGADPGAAPGRYVQLRATFSSDGDASPWLDWIDVNAR